MSLYEIPKKDIVELNKISNQKYELHNFVNKIIGVNEPEHKSNMFAKKIMDKYEDGIIKRDKNVVFKKEGEFYQVFDKDELIHESYDYNYAENAYYHYLDSDVRLMANE